MKNGSDTVAITGATGFLGWHLAEHFRAAGWRVRAIVRPGSRKPLPAGIEAVESPLESAALAGAARGSAVVVHAAALTRARDEQILRAVNVTGTEAVVAAANAVGARMVLISSQAAMGTGTPQRPSREDDPPRPLNAYGRSKLAAETVVTANARTPWTIVRPSAVYGPRDRQFLPLHRLASRGWFPLVTNPAAAFTFIYVEDLAKAIVLAATRPAGAGGPGGAGRVLFLGHAQPQTAEDVLRHLATAYQRPYRPRRVPAACLGYLSFAGGLLWRIGREPLVDRERLVELRAEGFVCAVDRARQALGFTAAVSFAEGVERTVQWYRDHGWVR